MWSSTRRAGGIWQTHGCWAGGIIVLVIPVSLAGILSIIKLECQCSELPQLCYDSILNERMERNIPEYRE